jgi:hypothetical protein
VGSDRVRTVIRVVLVLLALPTVQVGLWAVLAPRSFYDDFPGGGRQWVAPDGPYNEHFIRDFGGLNLALATILLVAAFHLTPTLVRTASVAALLFAVPHLTYHLFNLEVYETSDQIANAVTLSLAALGPVLVLALSPRLRTADPA